MRRVEGTEGTLGEGLRVVVVGAGVAGLGAAHELAQHLPAADVVLLEREARVGGLVDTEHTADGFVVEHGPDSLLTAKPENRRALANLALDASVVTGGEGPRQSFLARGDALVPMPDGMTAGVPSALGPWLRSPLLSLGGKARLCMEPLVGRGPARDDESVADFVTRRFGAQVLERVVDPLTSGIYGAKAAQLSMLASMPQLAALERTYGSVAWGMHKTRGQRALADGKPAVVSLVGGLSTLTEAFARRLGPRLRLGVAVRRILRGDTRAFRLEFDDTALEADAVVVAAPAYAAARLLEPLDADLAHGLGRIQHGPLAAVSLAFRRADVPHPMLGTGFIVPSTEGRATSACSFMCRKWPGRAPEGHALIRSFLRAEASAADGCATEETLRSLALADLRDLMGVEAPPLWARTKRLRRALPRYEVGHARHIAALVDRASGLGPLALAGNAYSGVGIGECLASGRRAAEHVLHSLPRA
jgi:protoporphyrinogen/coproporphyrinogen III oxidase